VQSNLIHSYPPRKTLPSETDGPTLSEAKFEAFSHRTEDATLDNPDQPQQLPIMACLEAIQVGFENNDIIIVCGEPGSGKTTQGTQLFARLGWRVECTQPTRLAATSLQKEVESQWGGHNGEFVGYKHGRGEKIGKDFKIMFCSDGLLFRRILSEDYFRNYNKANFNDVLVIDECHIFNNNIEHILALYKKYRALGSVPKLVIMSATINADELANYLSIPTEYGEEKTPLIFIIPGRQFPIIDLPRGESRLADIREQLNRGIGDVLDFYPGAGEIEEIAEELKLQPHPAVVVPLFAQLSAKEQNRVHEPTQKVKYIPATNVAETSLTIENVRVVIDGGLERVLTVRGDEEFLLLAESSLSTYRQRRGRGGRCGGAGYHINWGLPPESLPEGYWDMQQTSLHGHFLSLLVAGENPLELDFVHNPSQKKRRETLRWLQTHGFIDESHAPTSLGRFADALSLKPRDALMLWPQAGKAKTTPETLECQIDMTAIAGTRDFRLQRERSLFELVEPELHPLMRRSENLANLCGLEAIFREQNAEKRAELFEQFGIREAAAEEVCFVREELADRLRISLAPLGTRDLKNISGETLLEASAASWYDHIYRYAGKDKQGSALYQKIDEPDAPLRKLSRYALLGEPPLVAGRPFSIGLKLEIESESDILRLITQASVIPQSWFESNPELKNILKEVLEYREMDQTRSETEVKPTLEKPSGPVTKRHHKSRG
jgi:HrpA-like RNA helicase